MYPSMYYVDRGSSSLSTYNQAYSAWTTIEPGYVRFRNDALGDIALVISKQCL